MQTRHKENGYNKETQSVFDRWLLGFFELCLRLYVFRHTCFSETRFRMEGNRIIFKFVENNRFQNVEQPYKTVNNQFLRNSMIFVFYYFTYNITCT